MQSKADRTTQKGKRGTKVTNKRPTDSDKYTMDSNDEDNNNRRMLLQSTMILSLFIYLKVVYTNLNLGGAKMYAGTRAPEDTYQKKNQGGSDSPRGTGDSGNGGDVGGDTTAEGNETVVAQPTSNIEVTLETPSHAELKETQDRAQRIVNNDLENIPYTLVLCWGAVVCIISNAKGPSKGLVVTHILFMTIFVVCRIGHTISYLNKLSYPRTIFWLFGLLSTVGIIINGIIAAASK